MSMSAVCLIHSLSNRRNLIQIAKLNKH